MSWLEKLKNKKEKMQKQIQKGKEVTEQMKAEKLRKKQERGKLLEPGTIRYGLFHKQGVDELMKDAYERRKQKRERKHNE